MENIFEKYNLKTLKDIDKLKIILIQYNKILLKYNDSVFKLIFKVSNLTSLAKENGRYQIYEFNINVKIKLFTQNGFKTITKINKFDTLGLDSLSSSYCKTKEILFKTGVFENVFYIIRKFSQ